MTNNHSSGDLYATLGLRSNATLGDIKKAFRSQASRLHPDKNTGPNAARDFAAVHEAYSVLSDPEKRQTYDENRRRSLLDNPLETAGQIWQGYFNRLV